MTRFIHGLVTLALGLGLCQTAAVAGEGGNIVVNTVDETSAQNLSETISGRCGTEKIIISLSRGKNSNVDAITIKGGGFTRSIFPGEFTPPLHPLTLRAPTLSCAGQTAYFTVYIARIVRSADGVTQLAGIARRRVAFNLKSGKATVEPAEPVDSLRFVYN